MEICRRAGPGSESIPHSARRRAAPRRWIRKNHGSRSGGRFRRIFRRWSRRRLRFHRLHQKALLPLRDELAQPGKAMSARRGERIVHSVTAQSFEIAAHLEIVRFLAAARRALPDSRAVSIALDFDIRTAETRASQWRPSTGCARCAQSSREGFRPCIAVARHTACAGIGEPPQRPHNAGMERPR